MRTGRLFLASTAALFTLVAIAALLSPAAAQTPVQSCQPPLERGQGGQIVAAGKIFVRLTEGYSYLWNAPAVGTSGGTLRICIIEYFSQITFNTDTGAETGRIVTVPAAKEVLDLIAGSAQLLAPPTPTPAPVPTARPAGGGGGGSASSNSITPPNTGGAGLR